jgi:hypothetical protein
MFARSNGIAGIAAKGHALPSPPPACRGLAFLGAKHCLSGAHSIMAMLLHVVCTALSLHHVSILSPPNKEAIFGLRRWIRKDHFFLKKMGCRENMQFVVSLPCAENQIAMFSSTAQTKIFQYNISVKTLLLSTGKDTTGGQEPGSELWGHRAGGLSRRRCGACLTCHRHPYSA